MGDWGSRSIRVGLASFLVPHHCIRGMGFESGKEETQRATWHGGDIQRCESCETTSLKRQARRKRTYKRRAVRLALVERAEEGEALEDLISMSAAALFDR